MRKKQQPWSVRISLEDVPQAGLTVALEADEVTRAALAKTAGVNGLDRLEAAFELTRQGRDGLRAVGRVAAVVQQTCVVSLEPLINEVIEDVDLSFRPQRRVQGVDHGVLDVAFGADDPPEPLVDGVVDLGAIATEFLILGIDPYPRKAGIVFEAPADPLSGNRPFAGLAALKRKPPTE